MESKVLRDGSATKRAAILSAASTLFLTDGFDGTSVDAIAAAAGVSKRTVYDYFGDKQALLAEVVSRAAASLRAIIDSAIDDHLIDVRDLEPALIDFAMRVLSSALASSDYLAFNRLVANESARIPEPSLTSWASSGPEEAIAARLADFGRRWLLEVPNPRLAADHYVALTIPLALEHGRQNPDGGAESARHIVVEGVRVFLRAYEPRR